MTIKRFDLGRQERCGISYPEIMQKTDGRYVLHSDYEFMRLACELSEAKLRKLSEEMAAIGAGGVSKLMGES